VRQGKRIRLTADFLIGALAVVRVKRLATKADGFSARSFGNSGS
jgi:hypothetical protein